MYIINYRCSYRCSPGVGWAFSQIARRVLNSGGIAAFQNPKTKWICPPARQYSVSYIIVYHTSTYDICIYIPCHVLCTPIYTHTQDVSIYTHITGAFDRSKSRSTLQDLQSPLILTAAGAGESGRGGGGGDGSTLTTAAWTVGGWGDMLIGVVRPIVVKAEISGFTVRSQRCPSPV